MGKCTCRGIIRCPNAVRAALGQGNCEQRGDLDAVWWGCGARIRLPVPLIYSGLPLLADFIAVGQVHLLERRKKFTSKKAVFIGLESITLMVHSLLSGWSTLTPYILQRWQPGLRLWAPEVVLTFCHSVAHTLRNGGKQKLISEVLNPTVIDPGRKVWA